MKDLLEASMSRAEKILVYLFFLYAEVVKPLEELGFPDRGLDVLLYADDEIREPAAVIPAYVEPCRLE